MKKIAFINQRYGLEVNGGSEYYTRLMAEHLKEEFEVEVLTTKAIDYMTWDNFYERDVEEINGVIVRRFPVDHPRKQREFDEINAKMLQTNEHTEKDEQEWIEKQGPVCTKLIQYLGDNANQYDAFVFVTYLYYTSCVGILSPEIGKKTILIPTAHDEPYIYFKYFQRVFSAPKAFIYLTDEERVFVQKMFHNEEIHHDTFAVGIDTPKNANADSFKEKHSLNNYFIYVGRIDEGKGCNWLFQYFLEYKKRNQNDLKLVLMGKNVIDIPDHPDIVSLGFVSEEEKYDGIAGANALILPSFFESLSISVLEAMAIGTPVIVNGRCEVLKGHCIRSNAGLYYDNYFEFELCSNYMLSHVSEVGEMKKNAKKYVYDNFRWDVIIERFKKMIQYIG